MFRRTDLDVNSIESPRGKDDHEEEEAEEELLSSEIWPSQLDSLTETHGALEGAVYPTEKEGLALDFEEDETTWADYIEPAEPSTSPGKEEMEGGNVPQTSPGSRQKYPKERSSLHETPKKISFEDSEEEKEIQSTQAEEMEPISPYSSLENKSSAIIPRTPPMGSQVAAQKVSRGTSSAFKCQIPRGISMINEAVLRTETKAWSQKDGITSSSIIYPRGINKSFTSPSGEIASHLKEPTASSAMAISINSFMESNIGQVFARTIQRALEKSEEWLDYYLPLPETSVASSSSEEVTSLPELSKEGCFVRLNSLSTQLRNRAFQYAFYRLKAKRRSAQQRSSLLDHVIDLIDHTSSIASTSFLEVPKQISNMWTQITSDQESEGRRSPKRRSSDSISILPQQLELKALSLTRLLTHELYTTYHNLLPHIPELPLHLQEKASRIYGSLEELHYHFSSTPSFRQLPASLMIHSRQRIANARENLDEILEFMAEHRPTQWLAPSIAPRAGREPLFVEGSKKPESASGSEESAGQSSLPPPPPPPPL